ncbi:hypothetical protein ACQCSU_11680 [Pseudarthrobacter sp. O4]|uniref:hypothetical protein n=1 Tax=Pseudarthrobacter sp. O4 TaxID=3418417 RepID=UPI003CF2AED0
MVTATDNGIRITDVWQTREIADAFYQEQLGPISAEIGVPAPSETTFYDVHNYLTQGPSA